MDDHLITDDILDNFTWTFVNRIKFMSALFLSCCVCIGLFGNIMSAVIFSHSSMKSSINFLLVSLSISDTLLLISIIFVLIIPNFNVVFPNEYLTRFYPYIILYLYPISTMTQTCSVWTFVLISVERMIAISRPLHRYKLMSMTEAKVAQFFVLFCAILYNIIRFWEYQFVNVQSDDNQNSNEDEGREFELISLLRDNPMYFLIYSTIMHLCTHFVFPFSIILAAHLNVICSLKRARKQIRTFRRSNENNRNTTFMIMTLTLLFVIFNSLPLAIDLWEVMDRRLYDGQWMKSALVISDLANCLSVLNSACAFLIYLVYCKKYRRLFLRYLNIGSLTERKVTFQCDITSAV